MSAIITMDENGVVYLRRSEYLYCNGALDSETEKRMGDGDIVVGRIDPAAWKDKRDAAEIIAYLGNVKAENDRLRATIGLKCEREGIAPA